MWDPLVPKYIYIHILRSIYKNTISGQKKEKRKLHWSTVLQGHIKHACKISGSISKTAWTLDTEWIWGDKLEPVCMQGFYGVLFRSFAPFRQRHEESWLQHQHHHQHTNATNTTATINSNTKQQKCSGLWSSWDILVTSPGFIGGCWWKKRV